MGYLPLENLAVFAVKNTQDSTYLKRSNGKQAWATIGAAKNAWNAEHESARGEFDRMVRHGKWESDQSTAECVRFNQQTKYAIVRLELVPDGV